MVSPSSLPAIPANCSISPFKSPTAWPPLTPPESSIAISNPITFFLTKNGRVKILDFGLAKQTIGADDATQTFGAVTDAGTVIGTAAYMSPEQARGQTLDTRSDQFSFGLILYELAAGKRAFQRASAAETLAAIIREEAEPLPSNVPAPLRWTVERLLAKDPAERYDTTRGLYQELASLRARLSEASAAAPLPVTPSRARRLWWIPVAVALSVAAAGVVLSAAFGTPAAPRYRFTPLAITNENESDPVWSPDGRSVAYKINNGPRSRLGSRA